MKTKKRAITTPAPVAVIPAAAPKKGKGKPAATVAAAPAVQPTAPVAPAKPEVDRRAAALKAWDTIRARKAEREAAIKAAALAQAKAELEAAAAKQPRLRKSKRVA